MQAEDIIGSSDEELVKLPFTHWTDRAIFNTAQAELIRRQMKAIREFNSSAAELMQNQTDAINRFNASSTRLAWIMIGLTVATVVMPILQFFVR